MGPSYHVGLDVGTTSAKAVVFDDRGTAVAIGRAETPWQGTEVDADALADAAFLALARAVEACPQGEILGLGVTGLAESGVLLDRRGEPVAPVIAWHDTRDVAELASLETAIDRDTFAATTGLPLRQQWSLTKHRWLLDHHRPAREAVRRLNVAEWVVRRLGGDEATELSLASRTGWLQLAERRWWAETLDWSGASESLMPELVQAGTPLGKVSASAGLGRLTGAVLTLAGHDHQAAALGAGAAGPGDELDSCGTAEALVRTVNPDLSGSALAALADAGITTGWSVIADHWCLLGATQGGLTLQRVRGMLGRHGDDLAELDAQALAVTDPGVTVIAPPFGRLDLLGINNGTGPGHLWRAALEEVTVQAAEIHRAMSKLGGPHRQLIVTGGWAQSAALREIKRREFGEFSWAEVAEAGARGAALLAGLAAGTLTALEFGAVA